MQLTIIGGSSPFTVNMFAGGRAKLFIDAFDQIVLVGRNKANLEAIRNVIASDLDRASVTVSTNIAEGLEGANVALIQPRFGGLQLRALIEARCQTHGLFADETLGIGGLATALCVCDQWQALGATLHAVCPDALVVNMINPLSLSSYVLHSAGCMTVGLCEGPMTTMRHLASALHTETQDFDWACNGLNHRAFLHSLSVKGRPVDCRTLADLDLPKDAGVWDQATHAFVSKEVAQAQTSRFWRYGRATEVSKMRKRALRMITDTGVHTSERPTPWYEDAVLPFLGAWSGATDPVSMTLNIEDKGVFIESRFSVSKGRMRRIVQAAPPESAAKKIAEFVDHERATLACITAHKAASITEVLCTDPIISDQTAAAIAVREIVSKFRSHTRSHATP